MKLTSKVPSEVRSSGGSNDSRRTSSPRRTSSMSSRSTAKSRERRRRLRAAGPRRVALGANHPGEVADLLEMHRSDHRDHPDVGARDLAQLCDLAEPAHRDLQHDQLGVRLDAAERERHADLVVEAPLGGDRAPLGRCDRCEDVLRRRLPHRPGDRDDLRGERPRTAAASVARARCSSRGTRVAAAPRANACLRYAAPSPTATKRSPSSIRRESTCTPVTSSVHGTRSRSPSSATKSSGSEIMRARRPSAAPRGRPRDRRTGA